MATQRFFTLVGNKVKAVLAAITSTPDAVIAANSLGKLDVSWLPDGIGAEVVLAPTTENLAAGDFVNLYLNAGVATLRKADSSTNNKPCFGFVSENTTAPAVATMYILGVPNANLVGLTVGATYLLSKAAPGGFTEISTYTPATGNIIQEIGIATSETTLLTYKQATVEIA
jgi:hypothetical protein